MKKEVKKNISICEARSNIPNIDFSRVYLSMCFYRYTFSLFSFTPPDLISVYSSITCWEFLFTADSFPINMDAKENEWSKRQKKKQIYLINSVYWERCIEIKFGVKKIGIAKWNDKKRTCDKCGFMVGFSQQEIFFPFLIRFSFLLSVSFPNLVYIERKKYGETITRPVSSDDLMSYYCYWSSKIRIESSISNIMT